MKIDCGVQRRPLTEKDLQDLDRWTAQADAWRAKRVHLTRWHRWYAWFPVRLEDHDCRWFEWVERKVEYYDGTQKMERQRYYRAPSEHHGG